ncbi:BRO1 domain-containing protein BROX [Lamellibrachia satsuma]|nr:BRO1 domain-containing protein BROX [Lamellibrachia satsuma]
MAHWFHRNPLKATATVNFDFRGITADGKTHGICRRLKETRANLLLLLSDPNNSTSAVKQATDNYGALLNGLIVSPDPQNAGMSKLRYGIKFRWTNTIGGNKTLDRHDAVFEQISMLINVALWYTKHAAKLAGDEEPSMEQAKEVHKCLRTAAGIYTYIKDNLISSLVEEPPKGSDIDTRVLTAYLHQCTGEAQEGMYIDTRVLTAYLHQCTGEAQEGMYIDTRVLTAYLHQCTGEAQEAYLHQCTGEAQEGMYIDTRVLTAYLHQCTGEAHEGMYIDTRVLTAYLHQCTGEAQEGMYIDTRVLTAYLHQCTGEAQEAYLHQCTGKAQEGMYIDTRVLTAYVHQCTGEALEGMYINTRVLTAYLHQCTGEAQEGMYIDTRMLTAYLHQCTGEAQEVTIARAIELKHSTSIVSSLAYETARMFQSADDSLASLNDNALQKWRKYLQFKVNIYHAYAYNYHGDALLAQDKCGEAIGCLQESQKYYDKAAEAGKEYSSARGPGTTAKPHEHLFFRKLGPIIKRTLEKCVRENGFIYHQKVPPCEEYSQPERSSEWTVETYNAFNITTKPPTADENEKDKKQEKDVPPVKEADISQSKKDPNNSSGCVIA